MRDLKILIAGAGVAGLTAAALLQQRGIRPVVIEKDTKQQFNTSGYMLGILPLGGRVFNELDARIEYYKHSMEMQRYEIHKEDGALIKSFSLDFINQHYGSYRGISRKELIQILLGKIDPTRLYFGTKVTQLKQINGKVEVLFSNGRAEVFDLVIGADGIHSGIREMILTSNEFQYFDTYWGGWVTWLNEVSEPIYREYWGPSSFMGLYPVKNKTGVFIGGPSELVRNKGLSAFVQAEKKNINTDYPILHRALDTLLKEKDPFFWEFRDCKTDIWHRGHVVLLGDAAAGFLPTAGVGASMAMDSAAALVDELSRIDSDHLAYGLELFSKRQKERVERAQKDSRDLARFMFIKSGVIAGIRDYALRFYSLQSLLSNLSKIIEGV